MVVWFGFCSARQLHAQNLIEQKQRSAAPKAALARFLVPTFKAENNQAVGVHASTHPAAHRAEAWFIIPTIAPCISILHLKRGGSIHDCSVLPGFSSDPPPPLRQRAAEKKGKLPQLGCTSSSAPHVTRKPSTRLPLLDPEDADWSSQVQAG